MPYKRYGRKFKRTKKLRRRRGGKRSRGSGVLRSVLKDGTKYTTLYKTAVRVTSKPGTCNYVVLDRDPDALAFKKSGQTAGDAFFGDMTFYGNRDKIEAMSRVNDDFMRQQNLTIPIDGSFPVNVYTSPASTTSYAVPIDTRWKLAFGQNQYNLWIKSAITGANVNIVLYKCVSRYDIPYFSFYDQSRPSNALYGESDTHVPQNQNQAIDPSYIFHCIQNIHNAGWINKFDTERGVTSTATAYPWQAHQEGTTLYDNEMWCKLFKIVKSYKTELVPGQSCKLRMKQKARLLNPVADVMKRANVANKGQVVFVLKIQGAVGHEKFDPIPTQNNMHFNGTGARPKIGIMPAAVDVMCFKKFTLKCKFFPKNRVKNIVSYSDYQDDQSTENLAYDQFIDAAPSDYAQGPAVINQ